MNACEIYAPTIYLTALFIAACTCTRNISPAGNLADEMKYSLKNELLNAWYPRTIDTIYGGFLSDFTFDWKPEGPQDKMIVTQTRHIWTATKASQFLQDTSYLQIAEHGFRFIKNHMWDDQYGGFYMLRNRKGEPAGGVHPDEKTAYGNAFAIYSLAAYYGVTGDTAALNLAIGTFRWLDEHSHEPRYNGYFNRLMRDGSQYTMQDSDPGATDLIDAPWKDMNSSIHLLEAFTELYSVWPDNGLRERLQELLIIIRDIMITEKGYLNLYFEKDWKPVSYRDSSESVRKRHVAFDHVSFGHDVETAYLMLEASHILGIKHDSLTLNKAKNLVDHALANGWDSQKGGFYYEGYYLKGSTSVSILDNSKNWWVQAEGLNALLLMSKLYPDEEKYYQAFEHQWQYIKQYLIDHKYSGWYIEGLDNSPQMVRAPKASVWKINYHNSRSLMNCIRMLNNKDPLTQ